MHKPRHAELATLKLTILEYLEEKGVEAFSEFEWRKDNRCGIVVEFQLFTRLLNDVVKKGLEDICKDFEAEHYTNHKGNRILYVRVGVTE